MNNKSPHTPMLEHSHDYTRVLNCKRCAYESRAVNAHEALLRAAQDIRDIGIMPKTINALHKAIAQAEGK
jgi:hypothetical protein